MLSQMLMLMPQGLLGRSPQWAIAGAAIGVLLWAAGGAFSRYLTTLVAVAIGTTIGMRLPSWLGWQIDGMGTGVAGGAAAGPERISPPPYLGRLMACTGSGFVERRCRLAGVGPWRDPADAAMAWKSSRFLFRALAGLAGAAESKIAAGLRGRPHGERGCQRLLA